MPLDYLSQIKPLEDQGMSDADIASLLAASTNKDIAISELENFLDFENLAKRDALSGSWVGTLPDEVTNNVFGLGPGLANLFSHMNKPRSVIIDTTVSPWATDALALTNGLLAAGLITQAQYDGFYDLANGRPNPNLVEQDIVDSRSVYQSELAEQARQQAIFTLKAEIENSWINPAISDGVSTEAQVRAAIKAGL
jgi:hypothetical protein